ncbi:MAG: HAMP domain-containing sensor histidine kinase [Deltaproteobacteria bacterium]
MLRTYRPKSFLFLLLCGFVFVVLPLIALLVSTQFFISRLSKESADIVYRSVIGTEQTKKLQEQILSLERRARQYQVVGSPELLKETMETFVSVIGDLEKITALPIPLSVQRRILELHNGLVMLKNTLEKEKHNSTKLKTDLDQFSTLNAIAGEIHTVSSVVIFDAVGNLQKEVSETSANLLWQVGGVILLSILLILIFAHFLTRPVRAIEKAIQRMGAGDFVTPVRVGGPQDMAFVGERLNWLRQELASFEKEKSKFTAHVSHELKTPLASIREGASLLLEGGAGGLSPEQQEIAEILGKNAVQLQKLIENLLGYNMALAKSTVINRSTWSMTELVEDILNTIKPVIIKKGLYMDVRLDPLEINADRHLLHSVVDNLLSNALKHTPKGGIIQISLFRESGSMILDIADSGPGVAPEDAKRIFEPFFQGNSVSTGPIKGTGLGLAIAREYVAAHGGKLELVPEKKGGAHFRITLPLSH